MPPPKPRRAAFSGFFSGAGPDRRTAAGLNFRIGAAETPAECRCDQRPPCTPGDGAQDARILEVVAARSRGSHQMHPSLYAIAPMARPITNNNALRLSLSPITRAPRSLTPPSLAAATRRLVVPNVLLDTVPKGTRRQGGSGRRSARLAMLLRSCGWSGRVQEAGRMGGGTRTCAKHGRTRSLRRFEFKTHSQQTGPCATLKGAEMRAGIHTDRGSRGEGAGTRNPAVEALFCGRSLALLRQRLRRRIHSGLGLVARRRWGRDGY